MKITVHIADDHPMVVMGIHNMLRGNPDIVIERSYTNGMELLEGLREIAPDVLLLDIQMPLKRGDELVPLILKEAPQTKIIALTNYDSTLHAQNMLRQGASGYLLKTIDQATLLRAIESVYKGETFIHDIIQERIDQSGERMKREVSTKSSLTEREIKILELLVQGAKSKEIADKLFLSVKTVNNYRFNILLKLNASNTADLVRKALEMGVVK